MSETERRHPGLRRWLRGHGSESALEALADLYPGAAVFVVDAERRVLLWSRGAEELLGFTAGEVLGEHCLKSNRCRNCMTGCGIARLGQVRDVPLLMVRADGSEVAVRKTARAFFDEKGEFAGGIEVLLPSEDEPSPLPPTPERDDVLDFHGLRSRDPAMRRAVEVVQNVARSDTPVLIRGESGTGKELVVRGLHAESARKGAPFLAVNCAALTPSLLESELFGHRKGAFTGATRDKPGLFAQANGGTLFLDEVAELPLELQAKLLRVLQEKTFVPVGGVREKKVDVRVVSATHRSLRAEVAAGRFREDLMYRLRVVPIYLPPLRERRVDVELLLGELLERRNPTARRSITGVRPEAMRALLDHPWPGNVRELENVVDYAFAVTPGGEIRLEDLPPEFRETPSPAVRPVAAGTDEASAIREALARSGGHVGRAAELMGVSRPTFWRKRKKYGI